MAFDFASILGRIERELHSALPAESTSAWRTNVFGKLPDAVQDSHCVPLVEPTERLLSNAGKRWRPLLQVLCAQAASQALGRSCAEQDAVTEQAIQLAPLVELVHTASLIHDDIEDSADTRRGLPAAYITYGLDTALNAGSWLYFLAPQCLSQVSCTDNFRVRLYELYLRELRRLHLGQAMDIFWHRTPDVFPTEAEYLAMVTNKTGTLASLAAQVGTLVAHADEDLVSKAGTIAAQVGAGFQIIDDVLNLTTGNPGKERGDDIVEGKKSLPVILFAQRCPQDRSKLQACFAQAHEQGVQSPAVETAINLLKTSGSIQDAEERGRTFIAEGCKSFEQLFAESDVQKKKSVYPSGVSAAMAITELFGAMIPFHTGAAHA